MSYVYVLMEEGWEYNDETYFHPESGSGTPRKIFNSQEAADKECQKRNVASLRELFENGEANQYFYSFDDILPYPDRKERDYRKKLEAAVEKLFGMDVEALNDKLDNQESIQPAADATDEDWAVLLSMLTLNFWNVVECEKED